MQHTCSGLCWLLLLCIFTPAPSSAAAPTKNQHEARSSEHLPRVAIIGSGMAGASAAHFLADAKAASITVFEANDRIGGRLKEVDIDGASYELGGSIGLESNRFLVNFTDRLGLSRVDPPSAGDGSIGIFNGSRFVAELDDSFLSKLAALYRYQLSPFVAHRIVAARASEFERIYSLFDDGVAFSSAAKLWRALDLLPLAHVSLATYLRQAAPKVLGVRIINDAYITELAAAITRINYNQDPDQITALAGAVALAPAGMGGTFTIKEGTSQIPAGLLQRAGVDVRLNTRVTAVSAAHSGRWHVHFQHGTDEEGPGHNSTEEFDAVLIAAPLPYADITLPDIESEQRELERQQPRPPYQSVYTTFVRGRPKPEYFGLSCCKGECKESVPALVGTTQGSSAPFSCMGTMSENADGTRLVKMFSVKEVTDDIIAAVFEHGSRVVASEHWHAYPEYRPPEGFGRIRLAPGLYYVNAVEAGASCMEIAAVSGKNAALLVQQYLDDHPTYTDHVV